MIFKTQDRDSGEVFLGRICKTQDAYTGVVYIADYVPVSFVIPRYQA